MSSLLFVFRKFERQTTEVSRIHAVLKLAADCAFDDQSRGESEYQGHLTPVEETQEEIELREDSWQNTLFSGDGQPSLAQALKVFGTVGGARGSTAQGSHESNEGTSQGVQEYNGGTSRSQGAAHRHNSGGNVSSLPSSLSHKIDHHSQRPQRSTVTGALLSVSQKTAIASRKQGEDDEEEEPEDIASLHSLLQVQNEIDSLAESLIHTLSELGMTELM